MDELDNVSDGFLALLAGLGLGAGDVSSCRVGGDGGAPEKGAKGGATSWWKEGLVAAPGGASKEGGRNEDGLSSAGGNEMEKRSPSREK